MTLIAFVVLLFAVNTGDRFVVDASAQVAYSIHISRDDLRLFVDDIGLFERHMEGVVGVDALGEDTFLYKTSRDIPLRGRMDVDFVIRKTTVNDTLTVYRTPDGSDPNWMECRVELRPRAEGETAVIISLRVRMVRAHGYEVHWLAPLVGAGFIADRMEEALEQMLNDFAESSSRELMHTFSTISRNQP